MLQYLKNEANLTHTENGAVTYQSTQSECLDLFATIGALRRESDEEITNRFLRAYAENADLAMKTLFFARDIRGGIGERRVFRTILRWLAHNEPQSVEKNIPYIAEYPVIIVPLLKEHYIMLRRNLLYTAVTRAKAKVILIGQKQAVFVAIHKCDVGQRNTVLADRIVAYYNRELSRRVA